jgi:hypothetical protein
MIGLSTDLMSTSNIVGNVGGEPYQNQGSFSGSFDGVGDIATVIGSEIDGHPLKPTAAMSASCWVKLDADTYTTSGNKHIMGNIYTGGWGVYIVNSGGNDTILHFEVGVTAGGDTYNYIDSTVANTQTDAMGTNWAHIAVTFDGTTAKIYVNNSTTGVTAVAQSSGSPTTIDYTNNGNAAQIIEFAMGASAQHGDGMHGLLDDVAVWNTALDSTNIGVIYNSGSPFDLRYDSGGYDQSDKLIGYWTFDDGQGVEVGDWSNIYNHPALLAADATFSTTTP